MYHVLRWLSYFMHTVDTVRSRIDTIPNRKSATETTNLTNSLTISKVGVCLVQMIVKDQEQLLRLPCSFTRVQTSPVHRSPSDKNSNSRTIYFTVCTVNDDNKILQEFTASAWVCLKSFFRIIRNTNCLKCFIAIKTI